jgi:hypothetical protein
MEFNEIITFTGGINTDDTPQSMPKGDYRDFSYCRLGYNSSNAYAVETSYGTFEILDGTLTPADEIIGATTWIKRNAIVYFIYKADLNHEIKIYEIDQQIITSVIADPSLNFSREWPVFHANVIDDILKWTDGRWDAQMYEADGTRLFNPPYQINLQKALDGYYTTVDLQTIDAIKWPLDPPSLEYITDTTRNDNKLRKKLFKFIIQPIYENNEPGVWSMYSTLELPFQSEFITGTNFMYLNNDNGIRIRFNTGPKIIRKFNIAVQQFDPESFGAENPFGIFLELDKDVDGIADNVDYTTVYYGGVATKTVDRLFQNYDRLPITANCQEYLPTSQLTYTNFREGYDKIEIDVSMDYRIRDIEWVPFGAVSLDLNYPNAGGAASFTTDTDEFNATSQFPWVAGMVLWGPAPTESSIGQIKYQISFDDIQLALAEATVPDQNVAIIQIIGDAFMDQLGYANGTASMAGTAVSYAFTALDGNPNGQTDPTVRSTRATNPTPSLKVGATHRFGIVYGDRAYRDGTVLTNDSMNLFVPWFYDIDRGSLSNPENPFTVRPRITMNHQPPVWATNYWIVAQPANEILSFGHYTITKATPYQSAVTIDTVTNNRYIIEIDNYYQNTFIGASINHQIKIGDRVRFIRTRGAGDDFTGTQLEYIPYIELEVLDYNPVGGTSSNGQTIPRQQIFVTLFDTGIIEPDFVDSAGNLFGQLIEIYTPKPAVDDNGSLFISAFKDVYGPLEVVNPHTEDRVHGIGFEWYVNVGQKGPLSPKYFFINNDVSNLLSSGWTANVYSNTGSFIETQNVIISSVSYNAGDNQTTITFLGLSAGPTIGYVTLTQDVQQEYVDGVQIQVAQINIAYGDVYVRQRRYGTGLFGDSAAYYYYIEDPNYSDYWLSNIHNTGRTRVQDPNGKMVNRIATSIHSDSFIAGTQINGLSSFSLANDNIEDMNQLFGPVVRTYMSGREGKTLKCLQPKKENSIYIQFYPNEVGSDSTVRVSNRTFASWFDYKSLFGCSNPGANAILPNGSTIYFDNNSGTFIYSGGNGQTIISEIDPDSGKDYKFRTKTKALAAAYNSSPSPVVRTYVNESVGEVGFAFRFDVPYSGIAYGAFSPPAFSGEYFRIDGDVQYLYGYDMIITFSPANEGSGNIYQGNVNFVQYNEAFNYTLIGLEGVTPNIADFDIPGNYFTTSGLNYDHVVFDYVNMRWRSTYDYNFQQFCNLGQTLIGWGANNELYVHNRNGQWNFHGQPFTQKVTFVSNENPLAVKRYQDIFLISDNLFSIEASSEPNRSYPLGMKTTMPENLLSTYEGYGAVNYRKNLYDPKFFDVNNISASYYNPPDEPVNGWIFDFDQSFLLGETITIIQDNGQIFTGVVTLATYDDINDRTLITLQGSEPNSFLDAGSWYLSERALVNGQDMRANALTHTLEYNPVTYDESSILFSVGIKGVLS